MSSSAQAPRSVEVLADPAVGDPGLARERAEASAGGLVADGRQPRLAEGGDRAVDDDLADVEDADEVGDRGTEGAAGGARDGQRGLVAGLGRGGQFGERLGREAGGRRGARMAGALATVSRQPKRPQWHSAPSGSTTTWPISPAPSPSPPNSWPSRTRPAPMPRPTLIATRLSGRSSPPNRKVARAAARLSLATIVGKP